jgi:hypothetical protein
MNAFFVTVGTVTGLVVLAHVARMVAEPRMAGQPWYWIITAIAAALSVWSWRLCWTSRKRR